MATSYLAELFRRYGNMPEKKFEMPNSWMPPADMKRVILHWTAGSYVASSLDREHYHFLVQGDSSVIRGNRSIKNNEIIRSGASSDEYAAHTKGANTGSIGVSICAMAGATEVPFYAGNYPLLEKQWEMAALVVAQLCKEYKIPVTNRTVLTHAEVQPNLGIKQNGKWDIAKLPFCVASGMTNATACGNDFRKRVVAAM